MKKTILFLTLVTNLLFGDGFTNAQQPSFVKPEDAFKVSIVDGNRTKDTTVYISLAKDIYIYQDSLKFKTKDGELKPKLPLSTKFHDEAIYANKLDIVIDKSTIQNSDSIEVSFEGCSKAGICYAPVTKKFPLSGASSSSVGDKLSKLSGTTSIKDIASAISGESFGFVILLFFIGGLLMALTPCIFPMVPILSSILVSQSSQGTPTVAKTFGTSLVYVIAMAFTYAIAGVVAGLIGFDMSAAMQNPWVLVAFAGVFIALAISLFGYYEIGLPSSWQTKLSGISDNAQGKGYVGTAIMGVLSALIVGPCVAPILGGAILFISQTNNALLGGVALFVMSIGMGVPLLLIGLGAGKFMPKPGGWMNIVSRFFGVMMLAIAIMMLSRILPDNISMVLWSLLALGSAYALFKSIDTFRSFTAKAISSLLVLILFVLGVLWVVGAFNGATSIMKPLENFGNDAISQKADHTGYSLARLEKEIKESDKLVMVDFTKESCAACKELELITFPNPKVKEAMKDYKLITVDLTKNSEDDQKILAHYGIFGTPNILFFNSSKEFLKEKTITGFISPEKMVKHIESMDKK